jgi:hypothetical protein
MLLTPPRGEFSQLSRKMVQNCQKMSGQKKIDHILVHSLKLTVRRYRFHFRVAFEKQLSFIVSYECSVFIIRAEVQIPNDDHDVVDHFPLAAELVDSRAASVPLAGPREPFRIVA